MSKKNIKIRTKCTKNRDILLDTLYRKGVGYTTEEVVEEYSGEEKGGELIKRKVTKKDVPPDINALKTYLEYTKPTNEFDSMSTEELEREKQRLLEKLKLEEVKNENAKTECKVQM